MTEEKAQEVDSTLALYVCAAVITSLIVAISFKGMQIGREFYAPGFIARVFMFIFGIPGGVLGLRVGRWVRDATMPDSFYTTGGMTQIAKTKLFWAFGPQTIGLFVGVCIAISPVIWIAGKIAG